ncbi:MAG: prefoldin subunit alpha [Thermoplasmata archaeon]|nr:prefoldin subunit alpha [Thermoplasmata archaeon]MBO5547906.1 prefoldin subunit alpha [Candidatus Methanomethylophilaceae archaeon]MBR4685840.1 prefoldin subunit alpha [Candidatus Methanomethylophilaceae archaeon]WII08163.1 prefoldin subunit alpha [Methanomassiliicoccales archaeon LGM-RCC1]
MNDDELRQMMALMENYRTRTEALSRQVQVLRSTLDEVNLANESIKALMAAKEGDEIMIPIGASSFMTVKVSSKKDIVTGIGSGISVEKSPEDASKYMDANAAELTEALKKTVDALQEVQQALSTVSEAVQIEYANRQETSTQ